METVLVVKVEALKAEKEEAWLEEVTATRTR